MLREDFRDPILRQRGERWISTLADAVDDRLAGAARRDVRLGALLVAQWQGTLTVWGFTRAAPLPEMVRSAIEQLLARELTAG